MREEILPFERIRNLRIDSGRSQREIAEYLHIKQNTYSQYEIGTLRYPLDVVIQLAYFYRTSTDYLLGLTDVVKPYPQKKK